MEVPASVVKGTDILLDKVGIQAEFSTKDYGDNSQDHPGECRQRKRTAKSYIGDIPVDEGIVSAKEIMHHLKCYRVTAKPPEVMEGGIALVFKLERQGRCVGVFQKSEISELGSKTSRREMSFVCGKLLVHYLIAEWHATSSIGEVKG